jgi:hypothetical protein
MGRGAADQQPFKPAVKSPLQYEQDMKAEIGRCFSALRAHVSRTVRGLDDEEDPWAGTASPYSIIDTFLQTPLLRDTPEKDDMPDQEKVRRQAELGMWLAWAHVRDIDYWGKRFKAVQKMDSIHSLSALRELLMLQPVLDRLIDLRVARLVAEYVKVGGPGHRGQVAYLLDMNKLRLAGVLMNEIPGGELFLGKVADVVKDPLKVLSALGAVRPIYKRA